MGHVVFLAYCLPKDNADFKVFSVCPPTFAGQILLWFLCNRPSCIQSHPSPLLQQWLLLDKMAFRLNLFLLLKTHSDTNHSIRLKILVPPNHVLTNHLSKPLSYQIGMNVAIQQLLISFVRLCQWQIFRFVNGCCIAAAVLLSIHSIVFTTLQGSNGDTNSPSLVIYDLVTCLPKMGGN